MLLFTPSDESVKQVEVTVIVTTTNYTAICSGRTKRVNRISQRLPKLRMRLKRDGS